MPESNDAAGKEISQTAVNGNGANGVKPNDTPDVDEFGLPIKKHKAPLPVAYETTDAEDDAPLQEQHQSNGNAPQSVHQRVPTQQLHPASENEDSDSGDDEFKDAQSTPNPTTPSLATPNPEPEEPRTPVPNTASVTKETSQQTAKVAEHNPPTLEAQKPKDEAQGNKGHEKGSSGPTPEFTGLERVQSPEPPRETVRELAQPAEDDAPKSANSSDSVNSLPKLHDVKDMPRKEDEENAKGHKRGQASGTNGSSGQVLSEWSHQQLTTKVTKEEESEEDEWQTMPAFAPYDMYDDDNKLIAREAHESDDEANAYSGLGGAGKGYTRVQLDEDAQSATSLDENTQYLFKEANGTGAGEMEDEEQRDALSQMQATKDLLTEGQRIAYVGMTRLVLSTMLKEAESIEATKGSKKEVQMAAEAMKMWTQKMMVRLYAHMDISTDEQIMVEQLAEHGVVPSDLTSTLMQNARVKNPMAEKEDGSSASLKSPLSPRTESLASTDKSPRPSISSPKFSQMPHDDDEEPAQTLPPYEEHEGEDLPQVRTPSQLPTTQKIDIDLRWTVLCDLFLTLIADSVYDARSRVLLEKVGQNMDVSWLEICRFEKRVTDALEMQQAAEKENWNEDEHKENRRKMALKKRYIMMGLATVGGSLVIGLSAGLLAPVIGAGLAAGFTTIGVAGTSGFLAGTAGAAIITSSASAAGGIIAVKAANRRTGAVKTFEYRPLHNNKRVNLIVTVSGWMTGKVDDVRLPYSTVDPVMGDIYSVLWEPEMLQSMGDTINILATEALTQGLQQVLGSTLLIGLMAALQLPVVLSKLAYLIDNPWTVSLDRANSAGLILADSLIDRNLGTRPITFVGYSLGSRVIFSCLRELARKGAYGLVQNVYLFGSPVVAKKDEYLKARSVVAGRFVNGYARNDWILGYLFRLTSGGISRVAGLAPVQGIANLENVDVTDLVPGHMAYRTAMPKLLREVGWSVESDEFTEIEDPDPENHQARQRELINEIEEARKEFEKKEKEGKGKFGFFSRKKKAVVDRKEWETYEESKGESAASPYGATEDANGNNHGVLFDVDAIRAQLASEQEEELEVKELKSTLPPMKLDLAAPIPSAISPRLPLRESQSYDAGLKVHDYSRPQSRATSPRLSSSDRPNDFAPAYSPGPKYPKYDYEAEEEELQMTFDTAYHSPPRSTRTSFTAPTPLQPSPMADTPARASNLQRPDLKSSTSMPTTTSTTIPTINFDHNAWADEDEDFGKEKEIEMTFA